MRVLVASLEAPLHDVRGLMAARPELYASDDYAASQRVARALRAVGSWGVVYDSVRHAGGECAAVYRPRAITGCKQGLHLTYAWDGARIAFVYEKRSFRPVNPPSAHPQNPVNPVKRFWTGLTGFWG